MLEWAKRLAGRKRTTQCESLPVPEFPASLVESPYVLTRRFPELWDRVTSEFKRVVSVYNAEMKDTLVTIQIATGEAISVRKPHYPSAYLDVMPHPGKGTYCIRLEFYRSHLSTPRTKEETGRFQAVGDDLLIVWKGHQLTAPEFVRQAMELFFEGA